MGTLRVTTISDAAGTGPVTLTKQVAPKAWTSTNNTGTAINESFNISSLTDSDFGVQIHNLSSSMNTNTFCISITLESNNYDQQWAEYQTVSSWKTYNYDGSAYQDARILSLIVGDLA